MSAPRLTPAERYAQREGARSTARLDAAGHSPTCGARLYRGCDCGVDAPPVTLDDETKRKLDTLHRAMIGKVRR